jgi:cytochrome c1
MGGSRAHSDDMPARAVRLAALLVLGFLSGCGRAPSGIGNADEGAVVITRSACGSCHVIPGIPLADGRTGPTLSGFGKRIVIAGRLPNSVPNLILWLRHPQQVAPHNAMPETGLSAEEARDVAAYLYGLT